METTVISVIFDGTKVLMLQYSDYKPGPKQSIEGYWGTPGGRMESGETPEQAMRREIFEETGIEVGPLTKVREEDVEYAIDGQVRHSIVFACRKPAGELKIRLSDEHTDHRWVDISDLDDYRLFSHGKAWIMAAYELMK